MQNYQNFISSDFKVMLGKPVIKGTRITVELILKKLSEGCSIVEIEAMYPNINQSQILACIEYASTVIANEDILETA